jgi:hypothetical protein
MIYEKQGHHGPVFRFLRVVLSAMYLRFGRH